MIDGGVQDTPENHEILVDIVNWVADNYRRVLLSWQDDTDDILDYVLNSIKSI